MPKYVIERTLANTASLTPGQRREIAKASCGVLQEMGARVQWLHSYFTDDKIFCIYIAPDEEHVREHAKRGGFPVDAVRMVSAIVDPVCSE